MMACPRRCAKRARSSSSHLRRCLQPGSYYMYYEYEYVVCNRWHHRRKNTDQGRFGKEKVGSRNTPRVSRGRVQDGRRAWPPEALAEGGVQGGPPHHGGCWSRGGLSSSFLRRLCRPRGMTRSGRGGGSGGRRGGGCVVRALGGPGVGKHWRRSVDWRGRRSRRRWWRPWRGPYLPLGGPHVACGQRVVTERLPEPPRVGRSVLRWTFPEEVVLSLSARREAQRRRGRREAGRAVRAGGRVGRR